jgi:hypothetical protein
MFSFETLLYFYRSARRCGMATFHETTTYLTVNTNIYCSFAECADELHTDDSRLQV